MAVSPQIIETVQVIQSGTSRPEGSADLSPLFAQGRALVTAVGNQSNLILDPDLDSYYVMSLTVLRYPELLQVMHETVEFLKTYRSEAFPGQDQRTRLLILAGRIEAVAEGVRADAAQATLAGSPQLQAALRPVQLQLDEQLGRFIPVIRQMVDQPATADESRMLDSTYTGVLQALGTSWTTGLRQLNQLLQARVDGQFSRMWLHLGKIGRAHV